MCLLAWRHNNAGFIQGTGDDALLRAPRVAANDSVYMQ